MAPKAMSPEQAKQAGLGDNPSSSGFTQGWDLAFGIKDGAKKDLFGNYTPQEAAEAQTKAARVNSSTPFGTNGFTQNPDGTWNQNTGFSGPLGNAYNSVSQQMADAWAKPMDDGSGARQQAIDASYNQSTSRLNPQWDQRSNALGAQLANQGLDPNSQAYRTAQQQFGQQRNDAYSSAMNNAVGLGNQAQAQAWNQAYQTRMAPLSELAQMRGLLAPYGASGGGDYQAAQAAQSQQNAQTVGTGAQVVGAAASFSDERMKQNVQRLPLEAAPGVPLATFEYKAQPGQPYLGVIAQDLEQVHPEHVTHGPGGVKLVSQRFKPFALTPEADADDALPFSLLGKKR